MNTLQFIIDKISCEGNRSFMIDDEYGLGEMKVEILGNNHFDKNHNEICKILDRGELDENFDVYTYNISLSSLVEARENYLEKNS